MGNEEVSARRHQNPLPGDIWKRAEETSKRSAALSVFRAIEARFLGAWKQAVALAGAQYFDVIHVYFYDFATKKDQLRPNYRAIKGALGSVPVQDGLFLCALYSLYNAEEGRRLSAHYYPGGGSADSLLSKLKPEQRQLLQVLLENYTDW
jgi:hypothetical protein